MTIRQPNFVLVDECPDWCTTDHGRVQTEPGEHEAHLVDTMVAGSLDVDVSLCVDGDKDLRLIIWAGGSEVAVLPLDIARQSLLELAQVFLTAAYRLDVHRRDRGVDHE